MAPILRKISFALGAALIVSTFYWFVHTATVPPLPNPDAPATLYGGRRCELGQTLSCAIDRAQESVHLAIYALSDDHVVRALADAKARGCDVHILYDADQGCPLKEVTRMPRKPKGIMHQKILIIDGHEVWLGSANMTYPSLRLHENLMAALPSQPLAQMLIENITSRPASAPPFYFDIQGQHAELWLTPNPDALHRLYDLLDSAEAHIQIAMFTWTHPMLTQKVLAAHRRGVHVEVYLDSHTSFGVSRHAYNLLKRQGVTVRRGPHDRLTHHKFLIVDDQTLAFGSANWTASAFTRNEDCLLILHDLTPAQRKTLEASWCNMEERARMAACASHFSAMEKWAKRSMPSLTRKALRSSPA